MAILNWRSWVERFLVPLDDPGSRLFHLNIVIAFALVVLWVFISFRPGNRMASLKRLVWRKKYWWNRSTKVDYKIYVFNSVLKVFLLVPLLDWSYHIARVTSQSLERWNGDFLGWSPTYPALIAFTLAAFVWDDFLRFGQHVLMHKVPVLWRIHSVHHSAKILTPITLYRNHPLESAIATVRNSLSLGVATGLFIFAFESRFSVITLFGVNALGFLFNLAGANLRHSHIPLSFGRYVEQVLISPLQHQIHHSRRPEHFNKNFGVSLALWDRLMGSLVVSKGVGKIQFGIGERQPRLMELLLLRRF